MTIPQSYTVTIQPNTGVSYSSMGSVLSIKACSLALILSVEGGGPQTVQAGSVIDISDGTSETSINLFNPQAVAVTINFFLGDEAVNYEPADNTVANQGTYMLGSMGAIINSDVYYTGIQPTTGATPFPVQIVQNRKVPLDANGFFAIPQLDVTNVNTYGVQIPGVNNGHNRQVLYISTTTPAGYNATVPVCLAKVALVGTNLLVQPFMTIPANTPTVAIPTSDTVYIFGLGNGPAYVQIGELYSNQ